MNPEIKPPIEPKKPDRFWPILAGLVAGMVYFAIIVALWKLIEWLVGL